MIDRQELIAVLDGAGVNVRQNRDPVVTRAFRESLADAILALESTPGILELDKPADGNSRGWRDAIDPNKPGGKTSA